MRFIFYSSPSFDLTQKLIQSRMLKHKEELQKRKFLKAGLGKRKCLKLDTQRGAEREPEGFEQMLKPAFQSGETVSRIRPEM
jgi:hypothetical protein